MGKAFLLRYFYAAHCRKSFRQRARPIGKYSFVGLSQDLDENSIIWLRHLLQFAGTSLGKEAKAPPI